MAQRLLASASVHRLPESQKEGNDHGHSQRYIAVSYHHPKDIRRTFESVTSRGRSIKLGNTNHGKAEVPGVSEH